MFFGPLNPTQTMFLNKEPGSKRCFLDLRQTDKQPHLIFFVRPSLQSMELLIGK